MIPSLPQKNPDKVHHVSFRQGSMNKVKRHERVRSTSPPAYKEARSAQGSQNLRPSRRIRIPLEIHKNTYVKEISSTSH